MAKRKPNPPVDERIEFETFRKPSWYLLGAPCNEPNAINGRVDVIKWRVIVERVEEPDEVIRERIGELWNKCTNHHQWTSLREVGKHYGMVLEYGKKWEGE